MDSVCTIAIGLSDCIDQTMSRILPGETLRRILLVLFNSTND